MPPVIRDYAEIFSLFDTIGDGKVFVKHLGDILRSCGQNPTAEFLRKCSDDFKTDYRLSFDEFMPILSILEKRNPTFCSSEIVEVFRNFDRHANGVLQAAELKRILTSIGDRLTEDEADQILEGMQNSYGNVLYEDFVRTVLEGGGGDH